MKTITLWLEPLSGLAMNSQSQILLSVLIPSLPERLPLLRELLDCLEKQKDPRMEILVLTDNRMRSLPAKRNALMAMAQGRYLMHCDDDELLAPDYFATVSPFLAGDLDLVCYDAGVSFNGGPEFRCKTVLGAECGHPRPLGDGRYTDIVRPPWFWNCFRTDLARQFRFDEAVGYGEDWSWLKLILPAIKTHHKIDWVGFRHRWDAGTTTFSATPPAP